MKKSALEMAENWAKESGIEVSQKVREEIEYYAYSERYYYPGRFYGKLYATVYYAAAQEDVEAIIIGRQVWGLPIFN